MNNKSRKPPQWALRFFRFYCHPDYREDIEGDLMERFHQNYTRSGFQKAKWIFVKDVLKLFRLGIINPLFQLNSPNTDMFKNHFIIAWRNLFIHRYFSALTIIGLAMGIFVSIMVGIWVNDEITYNQSHKNYDRIVQFMQHGTLNENTLTGYHMPIPLSEEIRNNYSNLFQKVVMSSFLEEHIMANQDFKFNAKGIFMEDQGLELLSLNLIRKDEVLLNQINSVVISSSLAEKLFPNGDPIQQTIHLDTQKNVIVAGIFEDIVGNSDFHEVEYIGTWGLFMNLKPWLERFKDSWSENMITVFAELHEKSDPESTNQAIENVIYDHMNETGKSFNPELFVHPMSKWHLFDRFDNGVNLPGKMTQVRWVGMIGIFILILAIVNFINLTTARSERRSREVGIRKAIGSLRHQLIGQFFVETGIMVSVSFLVALLFTFTAIDLANQIAEKQMIIPIFDFRFWLAAIAFIFLTTVLAGTYPAIFLSSFNPLKVLKGTFRFGKWTALPRKSLVIFQFIVSVSLIIATISIYMQIQHSQNRPLGYNQDGLIYFDMKTWEIHEHFQTVRNHLRSSGAIIEMAESNNSVQGYSSNQTGFDWPGKEPGFKQVFAVEWISSSYGNTINWQIIAGRDFDPDSETQRHGFIINEAAMEAMGLEDPIGTNMIWDNEEWPIIAVVKNMLIESPYQKIRPAIYMPVKFPGNAITMRLNPDKPIQESMEIIRETLQKFSPDMPFEYNFANQEFAIKFEDEVRTGKLISILSILAIFISCIGLFGLTSFVVESRTKEIAIRKAIGAPVISIWKLISSEFFWLVAISCALATPLVYYFLDNWLSQFEYRITISLWVFIFGGLLILLISMLTVSVQSIKAAFSNPVKNLRQD